MLVAISAFILKLLSAGVLDGVLARLKGLEAGTGQRDSALAAVAVAQVRAEIARRGAQRDIVLAEQGRLVTALMRPAFAYPLAIYYAAVIADSVFQFRGNVAALPGAVGDWSGIIISAIFLSESGERITRTLVASRKAARDETPRTT